MKILQQISEVRMTDYSIIIEGWLPVGSLYRTQWGCYPVVQNSWRHLDTAEDTPPDEHLGGH
jgi:hypothetical protein